MSSSLCGAICRLAELLYEHGPAYAEGWNFGPNDEDAKPVGWIVDKMARLWGSEARWEIDQVSIRTKRTTSSSISPRRAAVSTGTRRCASRMPWRLIVDWAQQRQAGADVRKLTLAQIHDYQRLTRKLI